MCRVMGGFYSAAAAAWTLQAPRGVRNRASVCRRANAARLDGERDGNPRAGVDRSDADVSVEVQHPFAHTRNTDSRSLRLDLLQYVGGDAAAFVLDVEQ